MTHFAEDWLELQNFRHVRIARRIRDHLTSILHHQIEDERFLTIGITRVVMNKDLSLATVYFSMLTISTSEKKNSKALEALLRTHTKKIRHALAKELAMKRIPDLRFVYDTLYDTYAEATTALKDVSVDTTVE